MLSFLNYVEADLQQRAFNLSLAALLGNEVYNFGELVCNISCKDRVHTFAFLHQITWNKLMQSQIDVKSKSRFKMGGC